MAKRKSRKSSKKKSASKRAIVHTARYRVVKDGRIRSYHRSYTIALKARRAAGKGAKIVDVMAIRGFGQGGRRAGWAGSASRSHMRAKHPRSWAK